MLLPVGSRFGHIEHRQGVTIIGLDLIRLPIVPIDAHLSSPVLIHFFLFVGLGLDDRGG